MAQQFIIGIIRKIDAVRDPGALQQGNTPKPLEHVGHASRTRLKAKSTKPSSHPPFCYQTLVGQPYPASLASPHVFRSHDRPMARRRRLTSFRILQILA
jgi:hypothetical protein